MLPAHLRLPARDPTAGPQLPGQLHLTAFTPLLGAEVPDNTISGQGRHTAPCERAHLVQSQPRRCAQRGPRRCTAASQIHACTCPRLQAAPAAARSRLARWPRRSPTGGGRVSCSDGHAQFVLRRALRRPSPQPMRSHIWTLARLACRPAPPVDEPGTAVAVPGAACAGARVARQRALMHGPVADPSTDSRLSLQRGAAHGLANVRGCPDGSRHVCSGRVGTGADALRRTGRARRACAWTGHSGRFAEDLAGHAFRQGAMR